MNEEFIEALREIVREKGISEDLLFETIDDALVAAYKKNYSNSPNNGQNVKVTMNRETGEIHVYARKNVVEEVLDDVNEISVEDAKDVNAILQLGDIADVEVTPRQFGRVAAQSAKQVVIQRIKEAERNMIYNEFITKEYDIITGSVIRKDRGNVFIDLGKIEAVLGPNEQMAGERYNFNEKLKLYIVEVKNTTKGAQIVVSRTHPGLVKRLFELEVPEIFSGIVEIKSISREAGSRTKIAVHSNDEDVDPMGACVGPKGTRVQSIVNELKNEKIDIIKWSKNPEIYISNALSPAKVLSVVVDENNKSAKVVVEDNQLSLAIGKEGQNVRLAARLSGWKIDIKSRSQVKDFVEIKKEVIEKPEEKKQNKVIIDKLDIQDIDLQNIDVEDTNVEDINLDDTDLDDIDLDNIDLDAVNLEDIDLEESDLENFDLNEIDSDEFNEDKFNEDDLHEKKTKEAEIDIDDFLLEQIFNLDDE